MRSLLIQNPHNHASSHPRSSLPVSKNKKGDGCGEGGGEGVWGLWLCLGAANSHDDRLRHWAESGLLWRPGFDLPLLLRVVHTTGPCYDDKPGRSPGLRRAEKRTLSFLGSRKTKKLKNRRLWGVGPGGSVLGTSGGKINEQRHVLGKKKSG